jgi:hypothetical protein
MLQAPRAAISKEPAAGNGGDAAAVKLQSMSYRAVIATLLFAAAAAAAPPPARVMAPEVRAQGYRFVLEKVEQQRLEHAEFPPGAKEGAVTALKGSQIVVLQVAVHPPTANLLPNIQGLDPKVVANTQGAAVPLSVNGLDDAELVGGNVWRTRLTAHELSIGVTKLERVRGELVVYPRAKVVTLDFPLHAHTPAVKQDEGFRATLKQVKTRPGAVQVSIETERSPALSVSQVNPDAPNGVTAVTKAGTALPPNGGNSSSGERNGLLVRTHNLTFLDVKEMPTTIRVQALVRSGAPRRIKFTLPDVPLPDSLDLDREAEAEAEPTPLLAGNPFYSAGGGGVAVPIKGRPSRGQLVLGLSRLDGESFGPWRWLLAAMESADRGTLANIRPGRYRVAAAWSPAPPDPAGEGEPRPSLTPIRMGAVADLEILAGKTVTLSAFDPGDLP